MGVRRVLGAESITFSYEPYCFRGSVRGEGFSEARRNGMLGGGEEDTTKVFFTSVTGRGGGREPKSSSDSLRKVGQSARFRLRYVLCLRSGFVEELSGKEMCMGR